MREPCLSGAGTISAPLFAFGGIHELPLNDAHTRLPNDHGPNTHAPSAREVLALSGPSVKAQEGHLPVRGDLAHIRLAGRYFVPHYAVPMPHAVKAGGTMLRKANKADADVLDNLPAGATFDVLDIAGGWAWGQHGEDGFVGYVALTALEAPAA